jgi:hypothetical protein
MAHSQQPFDLFGGTTVSDWRFDQMEFSRSSPGIHLSSRCVTLD